MMDKTTSFFERFAKNIGLTIKIPRPNKTLRKASIITNGIVGTGLVVAGIAVPRKSLIALGSLVLACAAMLALDE